MALGPRNPTCCRRRPCMDPVTPSPPAKPAVLVAEDEVIIRLEVSDFLRECGFEVRECGSAHEARAMFLAGARIDILFSDINMPGPRDGIELAAWVEANYPAVVVVLTSGIADALQAAGLACKNVRRFVAKPYIHSDLEKLLRSYAAE